MTDIWNAPIPDPNYDANQNARQTVFAKIAPKGNWKDPINVWIDESDFAECEQAAIWFVGGGLAIVDRIADRGMVRVTAPGYYATIGA